MCARARRPRVDPAALRVDAATLRSNTGNGHWIPAPAFAGAGSARATVLLVCRNDGVPYQASPAASSTNHCATRARAAAGSAAAWLNSLVFGEYA